LRTRQSLSKKRNFRIHPRVANSELPYLVYFHVSFAKPNRLSAPGGVARNRTWKLSALVGACGVFVTVLRNAGVVLERALVTSIHSRGRAIQRARSQSSTTCKHHRNCEVAQRYVERVTDFGCGG